MSVRNPRHPSRAQPQPPRPAAASAPGRWFDQPGIALIPVLLLTRVLLWFYQPLANEDAYITFRFAEKLAAGHGLVYNDGERVMGFTSLPWTLWCALGVLLRVDPVAWTRLISVLGDVATMLLGARLLQRAAGNASAWIFAAFFSAWPLFAASAVSGMETSVMVTAIVAAATLIERRHPLSGPMLALVALMRPEGAAAALVLALAAGWRDRWIGAGLVAVTWAGLAAYYGSFVPQSVRAKASLYGTPGIWNMRSWWDWLLPFPIGRYTDIADGVQIMPVVAVFSAAAACGVAVLWKERASAAARAAAAGLTIWLGYAGFGVAYFWWYLVTPMATFGMLVAAGLPRIVRGPWIPIAAGSLLLMTWTVAPQLYLGRAHNEMRFFARVAEFLSERSRPGESVLLEPIGMIGYRTGLYVIDEVGLVSPAVAQRRLAGPGWYADVVAGQKPDWLVIRKQSLASGQAFAGRGAMFRSLPERDALLTGYEEIPIGSFSGDLLALFRRRETATP